MKFIISMLIVISFSSSNAQWMQLDSPTQNNLHCVQVVDSLIAYVGGNGGKVYKTLDGGESWFDLSPQTSIDWWCMSFVDANHGWVGGRQGTVARTTNGGSSWEMNSVYSSGFTNVIESMYFYDNNIGYIAGGIYNGDDRQTYIYKTTNGGQSWSQQILLYGGVFLEMSFINQNIGYVVGTNGGVYKTTNGGLNWDPYFVNTLYWLRSVFFVDSQNGVVMGQSGLAWKTTTGANNWNSINSGGSDWIDFICFKDKDNGWAVGAGGLCINSTDGGNSWVNSSISTNNYLWCIDFGDDVGMIVGDNGSIFKSTFIKSLNISQPNGGEVLQPNFYYQIKWTKSLVNKVYLDYSTNNGDTWNIIDEDISGTIYNWFVPNLYSEDCLIRLTDVDDPTYYEISDSTFKIDGTVDINESGVIPTEYNLFQNYPNPFNPTTKISFSLPVSGNVRLEIINSLGQKVSEIANAYYSAGIYEIEFDANSFPSGIYFYKLVSGDFVSIKKMNLIK